MQEKQKMNKKIKVLENMIRTEVRRQITEGKKAFKVNPPIGRVKYSISSHDGVKTHRDGSDFWDIETFKNKVDLAKAIKKYKNGGFIEESANSRTEVRRQLNEDVDFRDGKYRFYSTDGIAHLTYDGMLISIGDFDYEGGNAYWMMHSSFGGQKAFDSGKDVIAYFKKNNIVTR